MTEPADCTVCNLVRVSRRVQVASHCPEHGMPATVTGLCRCLKCCCRPGEGHHHPDYDWWCRYRENIEEGFLDHQARLMADGQTGRQCDPLMGTHSMPHVGCIMR